MNKITTLLACLCWVLNLGLSAMASHSNVLNIAHRGARSVAPENTLPAFEIAIKRFKADMIELDVHLSKDGIPVVIHDDTLDRCSDVKEKFPNRAPWRVGDFTVAELLTLDAGKWFVEKDPFGEIKAGNVPKEDLEFFSSGKVKIPTLKSALSLIKELNCKVNIELKNFPAYYPEFAKRVVEVVRQCKAESIVIFSSFDHEILAVLAELAPEIPRAALAEQPVFPLKQYVVDLLKASAYNPSADVLGLQSESYRLSSRLRDDIVEQAHKAGLKVYVWTVNDEMTMKQMIGIGVDGIFTDFPQRLNRVLGR